MPQVCSPNLTNHAVGAVFSDFGRHQVFTVRHMLELFQKREKPEALVKPLLDKWLPGASLKDRFEELTVQQLWVELDARTQDEVNILRNRFQEILA